MNLLKREILISIMLIFAWLPFAEGLCLVPSNILELQFVLNFEARGWTTIDDVPEGMGFRILRVAPQP